MRNICTRTVCGQMGCSHLNLMLLRKSFKAYCASFVPYYITRIWPFVLTRLKQQTISNLEYYPYHSIRCIENGTVTETIKVFHFVVILSAYCESLFLFISYIYKLLPDNKQIFLFILQNLNIIIYSTYILLTIL